MKPYLFLILSFLFTHLSNAQILNETVTDIDGNTYKTVKIGEHVCMVEYLKVTHFRNGDSIPKIENSSRWSQRSTAAYCDFYNKLENVKEYGRLYNWFAVNDSRGICPVGWHIPTASEWKTLDSNIRVNKKIKDFKGWWSFFPSNSSVLPKDFRNNDGYFENENSLFQSNYGGWWTSTSTGNDEANYYYVGFSSFALVSGKYSKNGGFNIICVKD